MTRIGPVPDPPTRAGTRVAALRRSNLGVILRLLRDRGPRSRSQIAAATGLPKATVTTLVADLVDRGLVRDAELTDYQGMGRPRRALELDARHVCGLGVEVGTTGLRALALDVHGSVVLRAEQFFDVVAAGPEVVLDELAGLLRDAVEEIAAAGIHLLAVHVAVPGRVDADRGVSVFAVNLGWRNVPVAAMLRERLGSAMAGMSQGSSIPRAALIPQASQALSIPHISVVNDAFAASRAELVDAGPDTDHLLLLTGDTGVGGGIVLDRRPARMETEIGHSALGAPDLVCACGRRGCWESTVGLAALLARAADEDDPVRDPDRDVGERLAELARRASGGDSRTVEALEYVGGYLCHGLSVLNDILGPQVIVLGGYFALLADFFVPRVRAALEARDLVAAERPRVVVRPSGLGFAGVTVGAVQLALERLFDQPGLVPGRG